MTSHRSRSKWQRTEDGTWTLALGDRGCRVRLFENRQKGGMIYREVQLPGGGKSRCSLGTRDRQHAEELGREIVAGLMQGKQVHAPTGPLRLGDLCDRFVVECAMFLDNTEKDKADARRRLAVLRAGFGNARDVRTLSENDVRQYEARRRSGGIRYGEKVTAPVKQRTVQADIKQLKQVLYWACSVTYPDGTRLLERNPLEYVRVNGEHDVARPVASQDRFEATRKAMQQFQDRYAAEVLTLTKEGDRARAHSRHLSWVRAELALVLLEATGRRRSSIIGLRWSDFDFATGHITWRPEHDKKRKTWVVPYPAALFQKVRDFQRRLAASEGCVFPRMDDPERHAPRELISQRIAQAEREAGLPKLKGGLCHPYRRKWRSERRHLPSKPVAAAGGWSDLVTMERCYDMPDDADLLVVTSEPNKRREPTPLAA